MPSDGAAETCAILAGGASRRMGNPKTTVELAGKPLIAYAIETARAAGLRPVVVVKVMTPLPPGLDCDFVTEPEQPRHPAAGIVAALDRLREPLVVIPCDLPLLESGALRELAALGADLATVEGQPVVGRWAPALLRPLWDAMTREDPMREIVASLGSVTVPAPPEPQLRNVNSEDDLRDVEELLAAQG